MQKQPLLTHDLIVCGHCNRSVVMRQIVAEDLYDPEEMMGTEWYILTCSYCKEINIIHRSYEGEGGGEYLEWFYTRPQYFYPYLDKAPKEGDYKDTVANDLRE